LSTAGKLLLMPFPLFSNLAGIAKGVALNGVLPYIVANTIFAIFILSAEIPKGVALVVLPKGLQIQIIASC